MAGGGGEGTPKNTIRGVRRWVILGGGRLDSD